MTHPKGQVTLKDLKVQSKASPSIPTAPPTSTPPSPTNPLTEMTKRVRISRLALHIPTPSLIEKTFEDSDDFLKDCQRKKYQSLDTIQRKTIYSQITILHTYLSSLNQKMKLTTTPRTLRKKSSAYKAQPAGFHRPMVSQVYCTGAMIIQLMRQKQKRKTSLINQMTHLLI